MMKTIAALSAAALLALSGAAYAQHTTGTGQPLTPGANGAGTVPSSGTQMNGTGQPNGQLNSSATGNLSEGRSSATDLNNSAGTGVNGTGAGVNGGVGTGTGAGGAAGASGASGK